MATCSACMLIPVTYQARRMAVQTLIQLAQTNGDVVARLVAMEGYGLVSMLPTLIQQRDHHSREYALQLCTSLSQTPSFRVNRMLWLQPPASHCRGMCAHRLHAWRCVCRLRVAASLGRARPARGNAVTVLVTALTYTVLPNGHIL